MVAWRQNKNYLETQPEVKFNTFGRLKRGEKKKERKNDLEVFFFDVHIRIPRWFEQANKQVSDLLLTIINNFKLIKIDVIVQLILTHQFYNLGKKAKETYTVSQICLGSIF